MIYHLLLFSLGTILGIILNIYQYIFTELIIYFIYYTGVAIAIVFYMTYITGIELQQLCIETTYNCIYYFSKLQLFVNKLKNRNPFLNKLYEYFTSPLNKKTIIEYNEEFGFFIHNNILNGMNYIQILSTNQEKECVVSQISFLLLECIINEDVYKIDLKRDYFNYYIVGNELNKLFFMYYIKTHINSKANISKNSKCSIKFIDQNVDIVELDFDNENSKIIIDKTAYTIRQHSDILLLDIKDKTI
jgi:hypothetical protein